MILCSPFFIINNIFYLRFKVYTGKDAEAAERNAAVARAAAVELRVQAENARAAVAALRGEAAAPAFPPAPEVPDDGLNMGSKGLSYDVVMHLLEGYRRTRKCFV